MSTLSLLSCAFFASAILLTSTAKASKDDAQNDLSQVKSKIEQQKRQLEENNKQQKEIVAKLREDDLKIADTAAKMNKTKKSQQQTRTKITELKKQQAVLETKKRRQESALGEQIRSAYSSGTHDYLKLLLNQQKPDKVQRTLTYYQYLNDARMNSIEEFEVILKELSQVEQEQQQQAKKLEQLVAKQLEQKKEIEQQQAQRQSTLKSLNSKILTSKQRLNKLENEEKSLIQTLARIQAQLRKQKELNGLSKLKRKLKWPVKGSIKNSFGTKKQGYLRWKGVLMSARVGSDVTSIHNGTVLFADWLKGYGLVIVIDHGDGYMSLYGHNQALLKNVGDRVEIGESIALAGQSGGQRQPGVYFEIRHKGKPVNPKLYCR
ncbi:murein hydrolase activator EnvC family protein [Thalassotalea crassostreae]|uniref:murein hydrolase activator EnvC family protein n=1 Tax=Thalassotalea crassostreae TaxID=1763536 RepID=UPI0008398458|nr:peptidoglycan DD-metalloendopeptidase family protein [Thalassotalea crassostreae]